MGKILLTGGAGYIGSHTAHYLVEKKFSPEDLVVFDNLCYGHREFLPKGVIFVMGDLRKKEDIENLFRQYDFSAVIHFAGFAYVGESVKNPAKYFENNVLGGLNLLEAMQKHGTKMIVFSSSCATYGIPAKIPIDENMPKKPINPYGETKLMFEKILDWYEKIYGIKSACLRYFNAAGASYGIGELHNPETHLIPLLLAATKKENALNIFGTDYPTPDGTCIRDYIHVVDLADAHFRALDYLEKNNSSLKLNLGTGKGTSLKEIIKIVGEVTKKEVFFNECPRREGDPPVLVANPLKAKKILNWEAKKNITNIITDAWEWHLNESGHKRAPSNFHNNYKYI